MNNKSSRINVDRDIRREQLRELKDFEVQNKLGEGSFGVVYKVRDKVNGEVLVMKQIAINNCNPGDLNDKLMECQVIRNLRHPYICRFKQYFVDRNNLSIIFEYCDKGDLESFLKLQQGFKLSETRIKKFVVELLLAINFLHAQDIIHRDIKPSNIFLKGKDYSVQLGDFGIACSLGGAVIVEDVGTLYYQSPEILNNIKTGEMAEGHDCRTDIWSLGCIIFQLCNLDVPFNALTENRLITNIKECRHKPMNINICKELRDLYEVCMNKNNLTRPFS